MSTEDRFEREGARLLWRLEDDSAFSLDVARALGACVRAGTWKGQPVSAGAVLFASQKGAQKQADALGYLGVAAEGPDGQVPSATFTAREDFGISSGDA